jgi:hypothetical protein
MRFPLIAAAIVALLLTACMGPNKPTSEIDAEDTAVETPEATEPSPMRAPATPKSPENTLIETSEYTGVILSGNVASEFSFLFDQALTGYWEPSIDDISRAEERIRQYLISLQNDPDLDTYQKGNATFILNNLEKYRRQYVGILVDGEQRIWCNAFLSDHSLPDWERVPVYVLDGGSYFWQIEYDLSKDECINFYIHGEA